MGKRRSSRLTGQVIVLLLPLIAVAGATAATAATRATRATAIQPRATAIQPRAAAKQLKVRYDGASGYAHVSRNASPPGANRWSCKPTRAHPRPVVLVHGTFADMSDSWQALSPLLVNRGYCVFALNYGSYRASGLLGVYGIGPIGASAAQLGRFIDRVLAATRAREVDLVGHSQGGMMPRWYLKFMHGAAKVHALVALSPSNHGTTLNGLSKVAAHFPGAGRLLVRSCPACSEQLAGSAFLKRLNAGGDTVPGVAYTVIQSVNDEVVTPYRSAFLMAGPRVSNVTLQAQCRADHGEHLSMPYDHIADADVLTALDPAHPVRPRCTRVRPFVGG